MDTPPRKLQLRATPSPITSADQPDAPPPVHVREVLQRETKITQQYEEMVDLTPRPSRRGRDYFWAMLLGNAPFVAAMVIFRESPTVLVYAFSGIVLLSVGLTWIVWFVMDRY